MCQAIRAYMYSFDNYHFNFAINQTDNFLL